MTIEEYVDHLLALLTYYITLDFRKLIDNPGLACVDTNIFFSQGPREASEGFWRIERTTVEALQSSIRTHAGLTTHQDFIAFREKPLLETMNGNVIPLHLGFVQEQLESGLFWTILNSIEPEKDRRRLFTDWGHLFEEYVSQMMAECLRASGESYLAFARFSGKDEEAFDGIVSAGDRLVVMEYRVVSLAQRPNTPKTKTNSSEILTVNLEARREQGLSSSSANSQPCLQRRPSAAGTSTGSIPPIRESLFPSSSCTFPLVLDVSDLEALRPFLAAGEISFGDCLRDRARLGSGVLSSRDFFQFYRDSRNVRWVPDDNTMNRFTEIMDRLSIRFFKKPLEAA